MFLKIKSELQRTGLVIGGLLIVLIIYLIISGILLSMFYDTNPSGTYGSMDRIAGSAGLSFIRNFHYWSSDLLLFMLFLHMTRVAFTKPSGRPRRFAWWLGLGLLIMVGSEMLIGTFLRGDQEAYEAYSHFFMGTGGIVAGFVPQFSVITDFLSGRMALFRFFILHSVLIPFGIFSLIILHGLFAPTFRAMLAPWKKVTDATIRGSLKPQEGFFSSSSVQKIILLGVFSFFIIGFLSSFLPAPLLSAPFAGVEVTKPPWWLLWVVAGENVWGLSAIVYLPLLLFIVFASIPLFSKERPGADAGVYIYVTAVAVLILASFWASLAPQVAHTEHYMEDKAVLDMEDHKALGHQMEDD